MKKKRSQGRFAAGKTRRTTTVLWRIAVILLIIDMAAMGALQLQRHKARSEFRQMAAAVREAEQAAQLAAATETAAPTEPPTEASALPTEAASTEAVTEPTEVATEPTEAVTEPNDGLLPQYRQFYQRNPEMVGWIRIEDTVIDYPVMHTPKDPEKYLHLSFQGEESQHGVPFIDYRCTLDSDNVLIYGHNMADDTMFHTLVEYRLKSFWREHPVIRFDTVKEEREYEIFAAFYDRVYYEHEQNFKFYNFIDAKNKADYNNAVKKLKGKSLYNTGITPKYGQQLIMLVTCTYREDNGRLVVVACEKADS